MKNFDIKKNLPWIICILLLAAVGYLTYKVATFTPVIVQDDKYEYLLKQHEDLQIKFAAKTQEANKWEAEANKKPKEITVIKIKYVAKRDTTLSMSVTSKEQLLSERIYN